MHFEDNEVRIDFSLDLESSSRSRLHTSSGSIRKGRDSLTKRTPLDEFNDLMEEIDDIRWRIEKKRNEFTTCTVDERAAHNGVIKLPYAKMHCIFSLKAHLSRIYEAFWSPKDDYIISVGSDNYIVIWDTTNGYIHNIVDASIHQPLCAEVSVDCNTLIVGGLCARVVIYTQFASRKCGPDEESYPEYDVVNTLEHQSNIRQLCRLKDGTLATVSEKEGLNVWDIEATKKLRSLAPTVGQSTCMTHLRRRTEDSYLHVTGSTCGTITLWDIRTKQGEAVFYEAHESDVTCLRSVPGTQTFLSGSDDTFCQLYDIRMDVPVARYSEPASRVNEEKNENNEHLNKRPEVASVNTIAISPSGRMFFSGCNDKFMYIWDILSTEESLLQREESGVVKCLNMSSKGSALLNVVWDQRNRIRVFTP